MVTGSPGAGRRCARVGGIQSGGRMHDSAVILDPTDEREPIGRCLAARPGSLPDTIGIVDISKPRGDVFCDA